MLREAFLVPDSGEAGSAAWPMSQMPAEIVHALGFVKQAAAIVNALLVLADESLSYYLQKQVL